MDDEIRRLETEIQALKQQLTEARRRRAQEPVRDYRLAGRDGDVSLSELFGNKNDLLVVHNMGASCAYCTLWADGFNSLLPHIENRTAFVLASPDSPEAQAKFASDRGWKFRMVSDSGSEFTREMGFQTPAGDYYPGVSAFKRDADGQVVRTASTFFGPGDDYCSVWPLFDLLAGGDNGWEPKYRYGKEQGSG
jgi:predicted dithiol-disulfide oxidoreductase (DUF899 family)